METAEKSSGVRLAYNARRAAGTRALERLGFQNYNAAPGEAAERLDDAEERDAFVHVTGERRRVHAAVRAMEQADATAFGRLLAESHASLRDRLRVSCAALDRLVDAAMESGALGARLTGAGFGGCAVVFCKRPEAAGVRRGLIERYYGGRQDFDEGRHLLDAAPAPGVLNAERSSAG